MSGNKNLGKFFFLNYTQQKL